MQLISKKFYNSIVPNVIDAVSIRNGKHAKRQDKIYHYASGYIMYRDLKEICEEAESGPQSIKKWDYLVPQQRAQGYEPENLKFGCTVYVPYQKVIMISGTGQNGLSKSVFQFHLNTMNFEQLPSIKNGRSSFTAHYDFGDRFIYVMGGSNE